LIKLSPDCSTDFLLSYLLDVFSCFLFCFLI